MNDRTIPILGLAALGAAAAYLWWRDQAATEPAGTDSSGTAGDSGSGGFAAALGLDAAGIGESIQNALAYVGIMTPRGVRNNNPGNLRYSASIPWDGQTGEDAQGYAVFSAPQWGVRALGHQLDDYYARGLDTVTGIISTWAPPTENDTSAYIADVAQQMGIDPDATFSVPTYLAPLAAAIIQHENGEQPYSMDDIAAWVAL